MTINRQLQDAIAVLGVDKKQALEIVESLPDSKSPAFVEALSVALCNANTGYAADWKGETLGLLWFAASKLVEQGQKVTVDQDRGKPTLDVADGSYFSWQGSSKAKHNDLAAAWNAVLGDRLQLRMVTYWDQSDTQYFMEAVGETAGRGRGEAVRHTQGQGELCAASASACEED